MKDEIKEILDKFDKVLENYELDKKWGQMSVDSICHLFPNEMIIIKNYITNLQVEKDSLDDYNRHLHNENKTLQKENERLLKKSYSDDVRITKAIEYCNLYTRLSAKDLLNILNGGNDNEN